MEARSVLACSTLVSAKSLWFQFHPSPAVAIQSFVLMETLMITNTDLMMKMMETSTIAALIVTLIVTFVTANTGSGNLPLIGGDLPHILPERTHRRNIHPIQEKLKNIDER